MAEQMTAQQRANLFAMLTRQNIQMLPKETVDGGSRTVQFGLPKARLLSGLSFRVKAKVKATHATLTEIAVNEKRYFYRLIRRVSLDLNNGFSPYVLSGEECFLYNMIHRNGYMFMNDVNMNNAFLNLPETLKASASGTVNELSFFVDLPVTTNPRDPIGLILLQNDTTNVTLSVDIGNANDIFSVLPDGVSLDIESLEITPVVESFSIPAQSNAYPDLSVLKICNGRHDSLPSVGQQIVKLSTGTIYRKIIFALTDENGEPMTYDDLSSNIDLVFNQADTNYSVSAELLHDLNARDLGFDLPEGVFVFDFSAGGNITNYGGTRDFIDTENLSEFWLRFNTNKKGKVNIVTECLARLQ